MSVIHTEPHQLPPKISNPITRASLFSTLLALLICAFTQPSGTLLFQGSGGWSWRLSPITSILETAMTIYNIYICRKEAHRWKGFRSYNHWYNRYVREGTVDGLLERAAKVSAKLPTPIDNNTPVSHALWKIYGDESYAARNAVERDPGPPCGWRVAAAALIMIRNGDHDIEDLSSRNYGSIRRLMDNSMIIDYSIQLWTAVSVIFILLKLCTISGTPLFFAVGLSFTLCWMSVQSLYLLFLWNKKEFTDDDLEQVLLIMDLLPGSYGDFNSWRNTWSFCNVGLHTGLLWYLLSSVIRQSRLTILGRVMAIGGCLPSIVICTCACAGKKMDEIFTIMTMMSTPYFWMSIALFFAEPPDPSDSERWEVAASIIILPLVIFLLGLFFSISVPLEIRS